MKPKDKYLAIVEQEYDNPAYIVDVITPDLLTDFIKYYALKLEKESRYDPFKVVKIV